MKKLSFLTAFLSIISTATSAFAADYVGMAKPWELGWQQPVTPVMKQLYTIHDHFLLPLIIVITIFVLLLLIFICLRFHHSRNPVASKTAHNTQIEIVWTAVPILILLAIAIPSLRIHYYMERIINPDLTVKVTGYQWYWHYDYPGSGNFGYDSYILKDADLKPGDIRQLSVDNPMVVPVNTKVRVLITGADVIHSWSVPSFGVKRDAVPGRLNDTWFEVDRIGTFYGQCSQLCGVGHGYMPIAVKVVSKEDFAVWLQQKQKAAGISPATQTATKPVENPVTPSAPIAASKITKPEPPAKNEVQQQTQEKKHSQEKGEGKPATSVTNLNAPSPAGKQ